MTRRQALGAWQVAAGILRCPVDLALKAASDGEGVAW